MSSVSASVTITLKADQTFEQTVTLLNQTLTQTGTWSISGSHILLDDVLVEFDGWNADTVHWAILDRDESPTGFAIFGGGLDPDNWVIFDWSP